jgi:predicted AlkP superfamily pyrophosphatase or phosphodiesterase
MTLNQNFIKPQYGSRCFSDLPQTIKYILTGEGAPLLSKSVFGGLLRRYDTVILCFIDAFGWRFLEKYRDGYPFLRHLAENGVVSKLTSQFPSTTAAHVTAIHTGLPVGQSGIYEWFYYEPEVDAMIAPLLFSFAGTKQRDTLKPTGVDPEKLYPTTTLYQNLQAHGVSSCVFQPAEFTPSTYSNIVLQGADAAPYRTLSEALINLRHLLERRRSPSYFFLYFDKIDALGHHYGPDSPQIEAEIDTFLTTMNRLFLSRVAGKLKNTLFLMTADHGQTTINPQTTVYLNIGPWFAGLQRYLKTNGKGELLVPGGSCRDMFLYVKEELLDEAQAFLAERLEGRAEVYKTADLIRAGFFGASAASPTFLGRVGNLVILSYSGESVWWHQKGKFEQTFYGHHGGLTREEVEIPLIVYDCSG